MHLSVIIPAYNEEQRIEKTLRSIHAYLSRQQYEYEIVVVSDGSTDGTAALVERLKSDVVHLRLVDNKENHGKGYVVKQGMLNARGDFRLFTDADNSTSIEHVEKFFPYFKEGFDIVIASIAVKGAELAHTEKFYKRMFGQIGNLWIQFWLLPGIWDSQRGFKMFTAQAAEKLFSQSKISGWSFDVEVLALARRAKYKIKEVPIRWVNDAHSKVKLSAYPKFLLSVLGIRWALWMGKYKTK